MRNKILMWALALVAVVWTSCSESTDGPTVVPPSWKGFNYVVKRPVQGGGADEYEQLERGAIQPGDEIKVYAVRKNEGKNVGKLEGKIHVRCTILYKDGMLVEKEMDAGIVSEVKTVTLDGWKDPYAIFILPKADREYESFKVEAGCQFYFKTFGNEYSEIDLTDQTSHEKPYLGHIYTDLIHFHPMNGGSASSGNEDSSLQYHTIYNSTK